MNYTGTSWRRLVTARQLPLKADTRYLVSFRVHTYHRGGPDWLRVDLSSAGQIVSQQQVDPPQTGDDPADFTVELQTSTGSSDLNFYMNQPVVAYLSHVRLTEVGATLNFDTADKRNTWGIYNGGGKHPLILARGRRTDARPNWAGLVSGAAFADPSRLLWNDHMPLTKNAHYRICAQVSRTQEAVAGLQLPQGSMGVRAASSPASRDWAAPRFPCRPTVGLKCA